jgi:hypothetical protein
MSLFPFARNHRSSRRVSIRLEPLDGRQLLSTLTVVPDGHAKVIPIQVQSFSLNFQKIAWTAHPDAGISQATHNGVTSEPLTCRKAGGDLQE